MTDIKNDPSTWDWKAIKADAMQNVEPDEEGRPTGMTFLGTVFALTPSGKYYMPWACSNVTDEEAGEDATWYEQLEAAASQYGMFITSGEGDPCDLLAGILLDEETD